MMGEKKSSNFGPTKSSTTTNNTQNLSSGNNRILNDYEINNSRISRASQEETLSNIEETIKFMEEKLFNPNYKKNKNI